jgi:hypothetical protein
VLAADDLASARQSGTVGAETILELHVVVVVG